MSKYKVGNVVKVVKTVSMIHEQEHFVGKHFTIEKIDTNYDKFVIYFLTNTCIWGFYESELILTIKKTKLAKKMYPNAEESEDGEWLYV